MPILVGLDLPLTLLVLLAAAMHATWNALVKVEQDRLVAIALINGAGVAMGAVLVALAPPMKPQAWVFLGPSLVLQSVYMGVLMLTYRIGDLSQVYPVARGTAPMGVVLYSLAAEDRPLPPLQLLGVFAICCGIVSLAWRRGGVRDTSASGRLRTWLPVLLAGGNGVIIAAYTVLDGHGVRAGGSPLAYGGWIFVLYGVPWIAAALWRRGAVPLRPESRHWVLLFGAGSLCFASYVAFVFALSRAAAAPVSALRESSVIFAALIGTLVLKEPFGARRIVAATLVAAGVVLIRAG